MTDDVWRRDEVRSPCVKICVVHPEARVCVGCYRSIDEIGRWSAMTDDERRAVLNELPERVDLVRKRRGGRAGRARTSQS